MAPKSQRYTNGDSAHEDRIQRLEESQSELKVAVAEATVTLHNLGAQVEAMGSRISDKIDLVVKPLHDTLHDHIKEDLVSKDKIAVLETTVSKLDGDRLLKEGRWKGIKTAIYAVTTGAMAIGLKELVMWLIRSPG